jgi:hypothetical protein
VLNALGAALALLLGVGVGVGTELRGGAFLGEWELPKEVVILGRVPRIRETAKAGGDKRPGKPVRRLLLGAVALIVAVGLLGVGIYLRWIPI